ncbi:hypothetical protein C0J52_10506 [Blattella germanica]|nr:hypothetical protein C0J52_10506 [Blattella germanica]
MQSERKRLSLRVELVFESTEALKSHSRIDCRICRKSQILGPFRVRQTEDSARYSNLQNQYRNHDLLVRRKWRHLKQFFIGPRGAWRSRLVLLSRRSELYDGTIKIGMNLYQSVTAL